MLGAIPKMLSDTVKIQGKKLFLSPMVRKQMQGVSAHLLIQDRLASLDDSNGIQVFNKLKEPWTGESKVDLSIFP